MLTGWPLTFSKFFIVPHRVITGIMSFFALSVAYGTRTSLSFAITRMVLIINDTVATNECIANSNGSIVDDFDESDNDGRYDWSQQLQGFILGAFFLGYVVAHIPGGMLSSRYGSKYVLIGSIGVTSLSTLLTPIGVRYGGATALIILRIISGLSEGAIIPSFGTILAAWVPLSERSKIGNLMYAGTQFGTIFGSLMSGYLLNAYEGWSSVFYFFGGLGMAWVLIYFFICYSDPNSHPFISDKEKDYLQRELGQLERSKDLPPTPWKSILTSIPVLAIITSDLFAGFAFFVLQTNMPRYLANVLKVPILQNGVYSSLPSAVMLGVTSISGPLSDFIINRNFLSIRNSRVFFNTMSTGIPGFFMIGASYAGCDQVTVLILFALSKGFMGFVYSGIKMNAIDLAPNYTGVINALCNGSGAMSGFVAPYVIGLLTTNNLLAEWRIAFWLAFGVLALATVVYAIAASGDIQKWNYSKESEKIKEIENSEKL